MNLKLRGLILLSGISSLADPSGAAQPPDVVTSDAKSNTAMGASALLNLSSSCSGYQCSGNTAAGSNALAANTTGNSNTAFGASALGANTTGLYNTAVGSYALLHNDPVGTSAIQNANGNTAIGAGTLHKNTTGYYNTAVGAYSLGHNTTGINNTASGAYALSRMYGSFNTATGSYALHGSATLSSANTGSSNTVSGFQSMRFNTTGSDNSTSGALALYSNTTGANNTAFGANALYSNVSGKGNAAQGTNALYYNTTGIRNLGIGSNALYESTTGNYNIALGFDAGYYVTTGSNNIEIGALGTANDNGTIQIGVQGTQTNTKVAGIYGTAVTGSAVFITSTGQLGVQASSARYKTDVASMPVESDKLSRLRPVTFHYKTDPKKMRQYGLIAEEVDKVYPELVIRDDSGRIQGVHYEELAPMLLSEVQHQKQVIAAQGAKLQAQETELGELRQRFAELLDMNRATQLALTELRSKDSQVAMR